MSRLLGELSNLLQEGSLTHETNPDELKIGLVSTIPQSVHIIAGGPWFNPMTPWGQLNAELHAK